MEADHLANDPRVMRNNTSMRHVCATLLGFACLTLASTTFASGPEPRARDLGVPFDGTPGTNNGITDVAGVEVGFTTLISGDGSLVRGKGPVRTGVTAILPRGKADSRAVFAGYFAGNGNGDMTGTHWLEESGVLETPILITGTGSVGVVRDAAFKWLANHRQGSFWYPVVAETADVPLNDMAGQHVRAQDVLDALNTAKSGPIAEGNVGGGTGMVCNGFKGGTGTASRRLTTDTGGYTVGVLGGVCAFRWTRLEGNRHDQEPRNQADRAHAQGHLSLRRCGT